jgi:hypothetical protein
MTQSSVERVLGKLVTDEAFRRAFTENPLGTLAGCTEEGAELNHCEVEALCALDSDLLARFAEAIDPRLQKVDLGGGCG